ncbi:golgin subfamily A member 4-like isoform X1 [Vespula squamosa]|uniref:Golgin subfamily A member 4-like isoform X1 n=1 Tax=Vespula squamosa TaxID=30214 RepID=A0ABD2C1F5_VESSQ
MEGPGISLFQGSESLQLNTSKQRLEEDEEQEDLKRRNEEINDLLTNAFDDLENDEDEDDDISSANSSYYQRSAKENEHTNMTKQRLPFKTQTTAQLSNDFGTYDHVDNSVNYNHDTMKNYRTESDIGLSTFDIQKDVSLYGQTPMSNKNKKPVEADMETSYELARLPNSSSCPRDLESHAEDGYTFNENYLYNYETPSNHYNNHGKHYANNGYIENYGNNVQCKQIHEFGGGDNVTSEEINNCFKISPNGKMLDDNMIYKTTEYSSKEQLEVLYSVRMKEIKRLTEELQQLQQQKETEMDQFSRKVVLLQAEVERSNISRNQAQHALIDAKAEIMDLQGQMASLKEKNAVLETTNQNMAEELAVAKDSVVDLQQKVTVLERVHALQSSDKIHEKFLKQAQEKHAVEIRNMQTQIDVLTDKLNTKLLSEDISNYDLWASLFSFTEASYTALEHKLADVRRAHEALILEKSDTTNHLAQALEKSQAQCRNLMAANNDQQILQLQAQIKILSQEKEDMLKNIQDLQNKLEIAKNETAHYDSLATTLEEESDSIRQMKLGDFHNRSRSKPSDDITNKLRGELQRCLAGQTVKRKEITRLENTLSQKEKELAKANVVADSCRQETARYAKRVSELEQELKLILTDQALKANTQIQKLSGHLNDVKKQYEILKEEKLNLEQKLEEAEAITQETLKKLHQESTSMQEKEVIEEYNKEYLEIHAKAVERVREEAKMDIVQLTVQLEQTQKELDHVKELYIDVCGTKEQLINEHKEEVRTLKEKYANLDEHQKDMEKLEYELETQKKFIDKLNKECESYKNKIMELQKDLVSEKRKKEEYTKKIPQEIERAKEEALKELRNAHPNQQISVLLPDHCCEHLQRISQLEEDNLRLEEKCQAAVEYQTELDDTRLKIAQVEISQESWKKKYDSAIMERNELLTRVSSLDSQLSALNKKLKRDDSDEVKLKITRIQIENEGLKSRCETLLSEKNIFEDKITQLELELSEEKKIVQGFENKTRNDVSFVNTKRELEKELYQYKELVKKLNNQLDGLKGKEKECDNLQKRIKRLEEDLEEKEKKLRKVNDLEKITEERDQLLEKLNNQAKRFEECLRNQRQGSAELNLSPRTLGEETDLQKIREVVIKEVREEMEQKVIQELRAIGEQYREKRKEFEERYKVTLLQKEQEMKTLKHSIISEKESIFSFFKAKEQFVSKFIENKLKTYHEELLARNLHIEQLEERLKQNEDDIEEERNLMAQVMTTWVAEIKDIKAKEVSMKDDIQKLREIEESLRIENNALKEKEKEIKNDISMLKLKYQAARKSANNYKEHAEKKENFFRSECKRIEEGYEKAMTQVQKRHDEVISDYEKQVTTKLKEIDCRYRKRIEQMENTKI